MSKTLKVGLIGAGDIARGAHFKPGWPAVPNAEVVAVCDISKAPWKMPAVNFNIPTSFTDLRHVLNRKNRET